MLRAGALTRRVTLQTPTTTQSAATGGTSVTFSDLATRYAEFLPAAGREGMRRLQLVAEADTVIRIRYTAGVDPTMQVVYGGRTFRIHHVENVAERNTEQLLYCSEVQA